MSDKAQSSSSRALKEVGGFEIVSKVGQGGMGAVFKARQKSLDRIVALKILPPSIAKDKAFIERFVREARASAKLTHPNVVGGIDVGQDAATGLWYFAMEFVDGPTAKQLLQQQGRMAEDQALKIAKDIAAALECAHQNGMVHRDVKPDNILLNASGTAKLADLGLARHAQDDAGLTQSGVALGTPFYMAPEQVRGQVDQLDTRADLYALGATLFHLVTGKTPFTGETSAVIMARHLSDPPPMANRICADVSAGCSKLILKLMQKEKAQRLQTPRELIEQIDRLLKLPAAARALTTGPRVPIRGATTTAPRDSVRPRLQGTPAPAPANHTALYAGAGAGGVVLLGVLAFLVFAPGRKPPTRPKPAKARAGTAQPVLASAPVKTAQKAPAETTEVAPLERRWREVKAYATAQPEAFEDILQRYQHLLESASGSPQAAEIEAEMMAVEEKYDQAAQTAWQAVEQKIGEHVGAGNYDAALAATRELPPSLAKRLETQTEAKRQALAEEANQKIAPALEKAEAASTALEPQAGLDALKTVEQIRFEPLAAKTTELKERLERDLANVDELRARKKLAEFLGRFDAAMLKTRDEAAAKRVAGEAKGAKELDPVRDRADAMAAILEAGAAETKRQEEALKTLKGRPFKVGQEQGAIDKIADGVLYVQISLDGGKITATKTFKIEDLSQEQRDELFPPQKEVPAALQMSEILRKLVVGQEDLEAAETALQAIPDFPLTPHYQKVIEGRRGAVAEAAAGKAWIEIAAAAGQPLDKPEQALPVFEKLQRFVGKHGKTEFAKGKAEEIAALRAKVSAFARPNLIANGGFEAGNLDGWQVENTVKGTRVSVAASASAAHSGKYGLHFKTGGTAHCQLSMEIGQAYRVSCWVKSPDAYTRMSLSPKSPETTRQGGVGVHREWTHLSFTFTAKHPSYTLSLMAYTKRPCDVSYDDVEVVKVDGGTALVAETSPTGAPADAVPFNGHAYKLFEQAMDWEDARAFCKKQGGYLACIETADETGFLAKLAPKRAWVGARLNEGRWTWLNGAPFDEKVGRMEMTRQATEMYLSWEEDRYRDTDTRALPFVCEWDMASGVPPAVPAGGAAAAQFVGEDTNTQGNWRKLYGKDGYMLARDEERLPAYATLRTRNSDYSWDENTNDPRALLYARGERRHAAAWYGKRAPVFFDLSLTDGREHTVAIYILDFASHGYAAKVDMYDTASKSLLDSRLIRDYTKGCYLVWRVRGTVRIRVTPTGEGKFAYVCGVFFQ